MHSQNPVASNFRSNQQVSPPLQNVNYQQSNCSQNPQPYLDHHQPQSGANNYGTPNPFVSAFPMTSQQQLQHVSSPVQNMNVSYQQGHFSQNTNPQTYPNHHQTQTGANNYGSPNPSFQPQWNVQGFEGNQPFQESLQTMTENQKLLQENNIILESEKSQAQQECARLRSELSMQTSMQAKLEDQNKKLSESVETLETQLLKISNQKSNLEKEKIQQGDQNMILEKEKSQAQQECTRLRRELSMQTSKQAKLEEHNKKLSESVQTLEKQIDKKDLLIKELTETAESLEEKLLVCQINPDFVNILKSGLDDKIKQLQNQVKELRESIEKKNTEIRNHTDTIKKHQSDMKKKDDECKKKLDEIERKLKTKEDEVKKLNQEITKQKNDIFHLKNEVKTGKEEVKRKEYEISNQKDIISQLNSKITKIDNELKESKTNYLQQIEVLNELIVKKEQEIADGKQLLINEKARNDSSLANNADTGAIKIAGASKTFDDATDTLSELLSCMSYKSDKSGSDEGEFKKAKRKCQQKLVESLFGEGFWRSIHKKKKPKCNELKTAKILTGKEGTKDERDTLQKELYRIVHDNICEIIKSQFKELVDLNDDETKKNIDECARVSIDLAAELLVCEPRLDVIAPRVNKEQFNPEKHEDATCDAEFIVTFVKRPGLICVVDNRVQKKCLVETTIKKTEDNEQTFCSSALRK